MTANQASSEPRIAETLQVQAVALPVGEHPAVARQVAGQLERGVDLPQSIATARIEHPATVVIAHDS